MTATLEDPDGSVSSVNWQWARSSNGKSGWSNISGATSAEYEVTDADLVQYLRATAAYTDALGGGKRAAAVTWSPVNALEMFYHATGGDNWTRNDNWLSDEPIIDWYGLHVDGLGVPVGIALEDRKDRDNPKGNNLNGQLPWHLSLVTTLHYLIIRSNENLTGPIPAELGDLAKLEYLVINDNDLIGDIPEELGPPDQFERGEDRREPAYRVHSQCLERYTQQ